MTCSKLAGEQRQGIVVVALHFRIGGSVDEISIKPKTTNEREKKNVVSCIGEDRGMPAL